MSELIVPLCFTIFIWWFGTGAILFLDSLKESTFRWSLIACSICAVLAFVVIFITAKSTAASDAYVAFTASVMVWAWVELTFLTGLITGPQKTAWQPLRSSRFRQALSALLHHELLLLVCASVIVILSIAQPNQTASLTFLSLWCMRASAKLNLFLGVRNWSEEFLPKNLRYLTSFFKSAPLNLLLPFTFVAGAWAIIICLDKSSLASNSASVQTGYLLVAGLLILGLLEHLLMVLPFRSSKLWKWATPRDGPTRTDL